MTIDSAMKDADIRQLAWKSSPAEPRASRVERMRYRAPGTVSVPASVPDGGDAEQAIEAQKSADLETGLAESERAAARIEAARREGYERGLHEAGERGRESLAAAMAQICVALDGFNAERAAYFARVEMEVVRLALGIAARVLHREALMDPLLLSGAVRVALGQLGETTEVRLRVPAGETDLWNEMLGRAPNLPLRPEVAGDSSMSLGECVMETQVGTVDLGVKAQLAEIERGFFDLLEQRPLRQGTV